MWTLTDTETGATATFDVLSGGIVETKEIPTGIFYPLRGVNPLVITGVPRASILRTPDWYVVGASEWVSLRDILTSGHRLTIADEYGLTYPCRVTGSYEVEIIDAPSRNVIPRRRVRVELVGVA